VVYVIYIICFCLLIDAIWVIYLFNKTDNFIYKKDKEIKELNQKHLAFHRRWDARKNPIKKDTRFDDMKRKLGGV
tara:strand:- start:126 stop:350 length:225 start_codon:yes stop_codon:yes gene_type:complete